MVQGGWQGCGGGCSLWHRAGALDTVSGPQPQGCPPAAWRVYRGLLLLWLTPGGPLRLGCQTETRAVLSLAVLTRDTVLCGVHRSLKAHPPAEGACLARGPGG